MKSKIQAFLDTLIMYDYIIFGASFVLFILFIVLGIVLRKKIALAIILILLGFIILIITPTIGRIQMHNFLFSNMTTLSSQKRLEFTEAIVVKGILENTSRFNFKSCKITANVHKVSKNTLKNYILQFKTIKKMSIIKEDIAKGKSVNFKIIVEPFTYSRDYNITLGAKCK
ncbi:MAG: hypothetical protein ACI9TV_000228 [Sulfurimonas sp.]|jgi:hypothetical protein|uniref:DUF2393 family protein n=1 Tax=Sulfurimonas sp. TaxID=2022749 RepID=UPI0039E6DABA